ncbi:hypothetical protein [Sphingomonas abaci]|uniref:Uncharacterized protein n=1 Tax=Sphingomonas abaci TaxID=237611 RepID=A0A7W7AJN8_9SPHN|nr:hypothetical protein [Sphingomonas abaci]MBB4618262.1 hypothetical protein [Sphingomonas abaci]
MSQVPAMLVVACLAVRALPALRLTLRLTLGLVTAGLRRRRWTIRPD